MKHFNHVWNFRKLAGAKTYRWQLARHVAFKLGSMKIFLNFWINQKDFYPFSYDLKKRISCIACFLSRSTFFRLQSQLTFAHCLTKFHWYGPKSFWNPKEAFIGINIFQKHNPFIDQGPLFSLYVRGLRFFWYTLYRNNKCSVHDPLPPHRVSQTSFLDAQRLFQPM